MATKAMVSVLFTGMVAGAVLSTASPAAAATPSPVAASVTSVNGPGHAATAAVVGAPAGVSDSVTRLYLAVFDRRPDRGGHRYWTHLYMNGIRLDSIAGSFLGSSEWQRTIGTVSDEQFVTLLYDHVLDRAPDPDGRRYWLAQAATGMSRTSLLLAFSESAEFVRRTGTASPKAPSHPALPDDSGQGRRIVYSNSEQRVWIMEADDTIRATYLVSGRRGVPRAGTYQIYSKSEKAWAGHDGITMNHMVRFAHGSRLAIGFHSIPRYGNGSPMQSGAQLGTYQSAGCVRQADHQAEALYHWARIGDMVVVTP